MKNNFLQLVVDVNKCVLSSKSMFYKTENFIKQTNFVTNIDVLLSKLCETILLNSNEILDGEKQNLNLVFSVETADKLYKFLFKFGASVDSNLNKLDILFFDYVSNFDNQNNMVVVDEYVKQNKNIRVIVKKHNVNVDNKEFNKLYLISNVSGVNLPKLNKEQLSVVETVDSNVLVQGVAGSGKTNLCIDKIIYTASKNYSGKVIYTTFSRGLINDTKLKVETYKKDLELVLNAYKNGNVVFMDDNHKKALENKLGIYFFVNDNNQVFEKLEKIIFYLENKVDYFLIEDLFKLKFGEAKFVNENYFVNTYSTNLQNHQIEKCFSKLSSYSKEIIYKEIYGMICGFYNLETKPEIMPLEEYVLKREQSFSKQDCETIYQIALDYLKHLKQHNLVDNNIASKMLLENYNQELAYSLAIVDEVQDYTQANLCLFKSISLKMFCVGDALQMINPSYFNFGYLKNLMYEKDLVNVKELKHNYRNSKKITEIIDALGEVNKLEFGTHNFVLKGQSVDNGVSSNALYVNENNFLKLVANSGFEDLTFVVASSKEKLELQKVIKSQEVLTVSEIKGLERNNIVAYNLLSSNFDKWQFLKRNKVNRKLADENSVFRYYYNLFYVGLSRAKQNLIVFENLMPEQFVMFVNNNFKKQTSQEAIKLLNKIIAKAEFTQRELTLRVKEFVKLEQFENAKFAANKIKDDAIRVNALRIIEVNKEYVCFGKHQEAGIKFWEYGLLDEAKNQFALSGDKILIDLVDTCSKGDNKDLNIEILKYFMEVKDNSVASNFIVKTVQKDLLKLKDSFGTIKNNLKKGRK